MNVSIDKDVLLAYGSPQVNCDDFNELLGLVPYQCIISTVEVIDSISVAKLNHLDKIRFLSLLDKCNNLPHISSRSDCKVTLNGESELIERIFGLSEICEYVSFGARIVLEDATNDGYFIKAIERFFESKTDFFKLISKGAIIIDNAGGSGSKRRISEFIENHHGKPKFLRCLVIVDADCRYMGDTEFENYEKQQNEAKYFQSVGVSYYVLKKRAQENYMPDEVFDSCRDRFGNEWVDAYLSLTPLQKDYYYIAEGFYKDIPKANKEKGELEFDKLPHGVQTLFHDVSEGNYQHLLHGPNLHGSFKSEFPKFFNDPHVCKTALQNRVEHPHSADPDELIHIVEEIRQLL